MLYILDLFFYHFVIPQGSEQLVAAWGQEAVTNQHYSYIYDCDRVNADNFAYADSIAICINQVCTLILPCDLIETNQTISQIKTMFLYIT